MKENETYEFLKNDKTQMDNDIELKWPYKDNVFQGSSRTRTSEVVELSNGEKVELNLSTQLEKKKKIKLEEGSSYKVDMAWKASGHYNSDKARRVLKKIYGLDNKSEAEEKFSEDFSTLETAIGQLYKNKEENLFLHPDINDEKFKKFCSQKTIAEKKNYYYDKEKDEVVQTEDDVDTDNLLIKGDNVQALISLLENYREEIQCIYIDPPFNTGNDDFAYNDKWEHSEWLTFMRDRLKLAKKLLRKDGAIFVHIDEGEQAYLKILMDEVFGRENFCNTIKLETNQPFGYKGTSNTLFNQSNYILFYSKCKDSLEIEDLYTEKDYDPAYNKVFVNMEGPESEWEWKNIKKVVADHLDYESTREARNDLGKKIFKEKIAEFAKNNPEKVFQTVAVTGGAYKKRKETIEKSKENRDTIMRHPDDDMDYMFIGGRRVIFYDERFVEIKGEYLPGELITDTWTDISFEGLANEGGIDFSRGKKPEKVIKRILQMCTENGDLVLDFFAGSGTTGAVAHKMGRNWIMVEQLDYCETLTKQRMLNVLKGDNTGISKDDDVNWEGGGSFKFIELNENYQYSEDMFEDAENKKLTNKKKVDLESTFSFYFGVDVQKKKMLELGSNYKVLISFGKNEDGENCLLILKDIDKENFFEENKDIIEKTVNEWVDKNIDEELNFVFITGKSFEVSKATIPEVEYEKIPPYFAQNVLNGVKLP